MREEAIIVENGRLVTPNRRCSADSGMRDGPREDDQPLQMELSDFWPHGMIEPRRKGGRNHE